MLFNPAKLGKISKALSPEREEIPKSQLEHPHIYSHDGREAGEREMGPESQELTGGGWYRLAGKQSKLPSSQQSQTPQESSCCTVTWLSPY